MADVFEIENFNLKLLDVPKLNIKIFHTMCTFKVTICDRSSKTQRSPLQALCFYRARRINVILGFEKQARS